MFKKRHYQINQYIKAEKLRVILDNEGQLGVISKEEALNIAKQHGKDLILVAENANPPVAKIIEFSKYKYQQSKKEKSGQTKSRGSEEKEVWLKPFMAGRDFQTRIDKARDFLNDGFRVKLVVKFTGRQITRREFGENIMSQAIKDLSQVAKLLDQPKWQGKTYSAQLKPQKNEQNKTENQKNS